MRNPFWRLKTLPWAILFQNALLTVFIATLLDIALFGFTVLLSNQFQQGSLIPGGGVGVTLVVLVAAGGIGALSVILMERLFRRVILDTATLWALVACLGIVLFGKSFLPVPTFLVSISRLQLIGIILGLFAQGRPYWR